MLETTSKTYFFYLLKIHKNLLLQDILNTFICMERCFCVDFFVLFDHFDNINILVPFGPKNKKVSFWCPLVTKNYSSRIAIIAIFNAHDQTYKLVNDRIFPSASRSFAKNQGMAHLLYSIVGVVIFLGLLGGLSNVLDQKKFQHQ